ncbi:hypothetical protein PGTUg99_030710 [Puccinia graminis f. sp. tritici]|uniref:Uncharacterized protein n=1 Tax=Puccinia graminis f. sp. tritici TaxID=56615 RepID=A0A5B0S8Q7_PUCGR|nr:hypothetical protein PGTUg99_030710 [Puccinia graminis f. sp. tritici]
MIVQCHEEVVLFLLGAAPRSRRGTSVFKLGLSKTSNLTQVPRSKGLLYQAGASAPREASLFHERLASRVASGPLSRGFVKLAKTYADNVPSRTRHFHEAPNYLSNQACAHLACNEMNPTKDTMRLTMACALCNTTLNIPTFETHSWLDSRWGKLLARTFVLEGLPSVCPGPAALHPPSQNIFTLIDMRTAKFSKASSKPTEKLDECLYNFLP